MFKSTRIAAVAALTLVGTVGCHDYLNGGELTNDPNRPTVASRTQIFQGVEAEIWSLLGSDPPRTTGIFAQQFTGAISQYQVYNDTYAIDANTTNGIHAGLYGGGGLVDIKKLEASSIVAKDSIFLGIARVQEGLLMGTGADIFGDLVYSQALNTPSITNPALDPQQKVYDSVQTVLSAAIANLNAKPNALNVGPGGSDLVYGGDPTLWQTLAHTLKARFYMHTAKKVGAAAYASALAEAKQGITSDAGNYFGAFTSSANEQNFYYQLNFVAGRGGYLTPNEGFDKLLESRNDPRRTQYFQIDTKADTAVQISATRIAPAFPQPFVTYDENTLIWAEAAYRTGDVVTALAKLNEERRHNGLPSEVVAGQALLNEILTEAYIANFQVGIEPWMLYNRTCTPNLVPAPGAAGGVTGGKIPGRLLYDTSELNTDNKYPQPGTAPNGYRNALTPASTTSDGTGATCLGQ